MDKAYRVHHSVGGFGVIVALLHPVFFIAQALPDRSTALTYIIPNVHSLPYALGIVALWIFVVLVIFTLYIKLPYHIWRFIHQWMGAGVVMSGFHIALISSDVSRYGPLRFWILGLTVLASVSWIYAILLAPRRKFRHPFTVSAIERVGDMFDVRLKPLRPMFRYSPGQFAYLSIPNVFENGIGHPFSIVSHPSENDLRFGIKISGDHTLNLRDVKIGDPVYVTGPYGRFTEPYFTHTKRPLICIAGGIGITPFVGLLREHIKQQADRALTLFHSVTSTAEALYHDELQSAMLCTKNVCYCLHVTKFEGRLTADRIIESAPFVNDATILLCGPERMMLGLRDQLMQRGVRQSRIFFENFAFI